MHNLTYKLAMAAAQDAGNRHMRKNGRNAWNEDDWNVAAAEFARLESFIDPASVS
jgi:hypothetical protein